MYVMHKAQRDLSVREMKFAFQIRVATVGRLSAGAKNAINSFVKRVFANSRQKTSFFRA